MTALGIALVSAGALMIGLAVAAAMAVWQHLREREAQLDFARESMEERYAAERREWSEERVRLTDRIQFPLARGMELMPPGDLPEGQSDQEVDEKWLEDERSRVEWDPDLQGFGSDAELVVPEQVAD